jgi:hypothetical protein
LATLPYIEASGKQPGNNALLLSPQSASPTTDLCAEFWYNMYGTQTGTLNLYVKSAGNKGNVVWTKQGKQFKSSSH